MTFEQSHNLWKDVFNYTKGSSDDQFSRLVNVNLIKKKIKDEIKNSKYSLFLMNNFNVFKGYFIQKLLLPLKNDKTKIKENELQILINLLSNQNFYLQIKKDYEDTQMTDVSDF